VLDEIDRARHHAEAALALHAPLHSAAETADDAGRSSVVGDTDR
jgi:hypothetical protein